MSAESTSNPIWVDGKHLIVTSNTRLPKFCVKTNQQVSDAEYRKHSIKWTKEVKGNEMLFKIISYFTNRQTCELTFGLSGQQRIKFTAIFFTKLTLMLLGMIGMFAGATLHWGEGVLLGCFAICLLFMILLPFGNKPLAIVREEQGRFWITGCSKDFLNRLQRSSG